MELHFEIRTLRGMSNYWCVTECYICHLKGDKIWEFSSDPYVDLALGLVWKCCVIGWKRTVVLTSRGMFLGSWTEVMRRLLFGSVGGGGSDRGSASNSYDGRHSEEVVGVGSGSEHRIFSLFLFFKLKCVFWYLFCFPDDAWLVDLDVSYDQCFPTFLSWRNS
jgi:hypothetical protein